MIRKSIVMIPIVLLLLACDNNGNHGEPSPASSPKKEKMEGIRKDLVTIEYSSGGDPSKPRTVYIRNLVEKKINVTYKRMLLGEATTYGKLTLQAYERHYIGYSSKLVNLGTYCTTPIQTVIISAK